MTQFKYKPSNKRSQASKQLKFGVGINDADYVTSNWDNVNKKQIHCPIYARWYAMIDRCYNVHGNKKVQYKTYLDCTVCPEWLIFSNFKKWMETKNWQGKHLDKDLLAGDNKVYSPETCVFIDAKLNSLIKDKNKNPFIYSLPTKKGFTYYARIGKIRLGTFHNIDDAKDICFKYKKQALLSCIEDESDERIINAVNTIIATQN